MTTAEVLAKVASGEIQASEAATLIDAMKSNGKATTELTYKVSAKGAVSIYGLGRWPVTLYGEQWARVDSDAERKRRAEFIKANKSKLASKG
jgi:hypothetical protein